MISCTQLRLIWNSGYSQSSFKAFSSSKVTKRETRHLPSKNAFSMTLHKHSFPKICNELNNDLRVQGLDRHKPEADFNYQMKRIEPNAAHIRRKQFALGKEKVSLDKKEEVVRRERCLEECEEEGRDRHTPEVDFNYQMKRKERNAEHILGRQSGLEKERVLLDKDEEVVRRKMLLEECEEEDHERQTSETEFEFQMLAIEYNAEHIRRRQSYMEKERVLLDNEEELVKRPKPLEEYEEKDRCRHASETEFGYQMKAIERNAEHIRKKESYLEKERFLLNQEEELVRQQKYLEEYEEEEIKTLQEKLEAPKDDITSNRASISSTENENWGKVNAHFIEQQRLVEITLQKNRIDLAGSKVSLASRDILIKQLQRKELKYTQEKLEASMDDVVLTRTPISSTENEIWVSAEARFIEKEILLETRLQKYKIDLASATATIADKDLLIKQLQKMESKYPQENLEASKGDIASNTASIYRTENDSWGIVKNGLIEQQRFLETRLQKYRTNLASATATITGKDILIRELQQMVVGQEQDTRKKANQMGNLEMRLSAAIKKNTKLELDVKKREYLMFSASQSERPPEQPRQKDSFVESFIDSSCKKRESDSPSTAVSRRPISADDGNEVDGDKLSTDIQLSNTQTRAASENESDIESATDRNALRIACDGRTRIICHLSTNYQSSDKNETLIRGNSENVPDETWHSNKTAQYPLPRWDRKSGSIDGEDECHVSNMLPRNPGNESMSCLVM